MESKTIQLLANHFKVVGLQQSLLVMVTFSVFVFTFIKDVSDGDFFHVNFF